jgi:hypothetical protein
MQTAASLQYLRTYVLPQPPRIFQSPPPDPSARNISTSWKPWCQSQEFSLSKHCEPNLAAGVLTITESVMCFVYWLISKVAEARLQSKASLWRRWPSLSVHAIGLPGSRVLGNWFLMPVLRAAAVSRKLPYLLGQYSGYVQAMAVPHTAVPAVRVATYSTLVSSNPRAHVRHHGPGARPTASTAGSANHGHVERATGMLIETPLDVRVP